MEKQEKKRYTLIGLLSLLILLLLTGAGIILFKSRSGVEIRNSKFDDIMVLKDQLSLKYDGEVQNEIDGTRYKIYVDSKYACFTDDNDPIDVLGGVAYFGNTSYKRINYEFDGEKYLVNPGTTTYNTSEEFNNVYSLKKLTDETLSQELVIKSEFLNEFKTLLFDEYLTPSGQEVKNIILNMSDDKTTLMFQTYNEEGTLLMNYRYYASLNNFNLLNDI